MKRIAAGILGVVLLAGCGSGSGRDVDPYQDPAQVELQAPQMSLPALEKTTRQVGEAIIQRRKQAYQLEEEIREVPFKDQYQEKAVRLRDRASKLQLEEIPRLRRLYDIYMEAYLKKGGRFERIRIPGL